VGVDDRTTITAGTSIASAHRIGIDKAEMAAVKWPRSTVSQSRANRECGAERCSNAAAAPATV